MDGDAVAAAENVPLHRYQRANKGYVEALGDGATLTLMQIPAGELWMGTGAADAGGRAAERPQHRVQISRFFMGQSPVTQAQWRVVASYNRVDRDLEPAPSHFKGADLPVERVSWYDATEFCRRLSVRTRLVYRLPSEAEWEYACRAGTETAYHSGNWITTELANFRDGDGRGVGTTTAVKRYPANRWGLYDMHGNVWEWCQDHWHKNYDGAPTDGSAWLSSGNRNLRVCRGGSWDGDPGDCRSAYRIRVEPDDRYAFIGFRVCCSALRA